MGEKQTQEIKAKLSYLRQGPRKVRLVCDVIRGMDLVRARAELLHIPKRASGPLLKLLDSAVANAKNNIHVSEDVLWVKQARVDQGPSLKRFMPRAHGRAGQILKRSCHVTLVLGVRSNEKNESKVKNTKGTKK